MDRKLAALGVFALAGVLSAQPNPTQARPGASPNQNASLDKQPLYRVTVVSRSTPAINYRVRGGETKVDLKGTALMPRAKGYVEVGVKKGYIELDANMDEISGPASQFGPEYMTYVMWAISPEGRATNLGEVQLRDRDNARIEVTTELQSFGLIVTAEPYFAVTQPSDVVVMENIVRADTTGKVDVVDAKYELLQRGQYTMNAAGQARPVTLDVKRTPLELYQARNAVQIARWAGADKYAGDSFQKAEKLLTQAEDYQNRKERRSVIMIGREAVQQAEDSRLIALKRIEEERLERERQAAADREAAAKADAERAAQLAAEQARQRAAAEEARRLEEQRRAEAERNAAQQSALAAQAEQARLAAQQERLAAEKAKAEADAARQAALVQQQAAQQEAERARLAATEADRARQAAEADKEALRARLLQQFNQILETRDTVRGLVVNISDVLFDTGRYTLRSAAREKLARLSGIVLAYPGLRLEVEGHTDSVGSDSYNQRLSEQRAEEVRAYLIKSGIQPTNVTSKGFGESMPVADNNNAAGRQQNRRVEMVVSGEVIGTKISEIRGTTTTVPAAPQQ
jgi:outer membrane protein OmpA-like peptidoglycan-associated protein